MPLSLTHTLPTIARLPPGSPLSFSFHDRLLLLLARAPSYHHSISIHSFLLFPSVSLFLSPPYCVQLLHPALPFPKIHLINPVSPFPPPLTHPTVIYSQFSSSQPHTLPYPPSPSQYLSSFSSFPSLYLTTHSSPFLHGYLQALRQFLRTHFCTTRITQYVRPKAVAV